MRRLDSGLLKAIFGDNLKGLWLPEFRKDNGDVRDLINGNDMELVDANIVSRPVACGLRGPTVHFDGDDDHESTTTSTTNSLSSTEQMIGARNSSSPQQHMDGTLYAFAEYVEALSDDDVEDQMKVLRKRWDAL